MVLRMLLYAYACSRSRALATSFSGPEACLRIAGKHQRKEASGALSDLLASPAPPDETDEDLLLGRDFIFFGSRIASTLHGSGHRLLVAYLGRVDLQNLLVVCRGLHRREGEDDWRRMLVDPAPFGELSVESLAEIDDLSALAYELPPHPYSPVLREGLEIDDERRLFWLETRLEQAFWEEINTLIKSLLPLDRLAAKEIFGLRADLDRFNLIHRGWRNGTPSDEILQGLPPLGILFRPEEVRRLLDSEAPGENLLRLLPGDADDLLGVPGEVLLARRLYQRLHRILRSHPFDISVPLASLLLKELEIRDLRIAVNSARFRRPEEELHQLLASEVA